MIGTIVGVLVALVFFWDVLVYSIEVCSSDDDLNDDNDWMIR
jgi:hypothetical protein